MGLLNRMNFLVLDGAKIGHLPEMAKRDCLDYQMIKEVKLMGHCLEREEILITFAHPLFPIGIMIINSKQMYGNKTIKVFLIGS